MSKDEQDWMRSVLLAIERGTSTYDVSVPGLVRISTDLPPQAASEAVEGGGSPELPYHVESVAWLVGQLDRIRVIQSGRELVGIDSPDVQPNWRPTIDDVIAELRRSV